MNINKIFNERKLVLVDFSLTPNFNCYYCDYTTTNKNQMKEHLTEEHYNLIRKDYITERTLSYFNGCSSQKNIELRRLIMDFLENTFEDINNQNEKDFIELFTIKINKYLKSEGLK